MIADITPARVRIEHAAEPHNLCLAFWKAQRGKSYNPDVQDYRRNLDARLLDLRDQIRSGQLRVGQYRYFKVFDPKERTICAAAFEERVLHHALMNVCHDRFEQVQISDSYASRPGKGVHAALRRAAGFARRYPWFLQLDVRKFFESVCHLTLKAQLRRLFRDKRLLSLLDQIINSYEASPGRGLPIGNLCSQYFANHFLCGLDHYIKEQLRFRAYVRYMDDFVLWHNDRERLKAALADVSRYVHDRLNAEFKPPRRNASDRGLPFLGYLILPHHIRLTQRSKRRYIHKLSLVHERYATGLWSEAECQRRAASLTAFTGHADADTLRRAFMARLRQRHNDSDL